MAVALSLPQSLQTRAQRDRGSGGRGGRVSSRRPLGTMPHPRSGPSGGFLPPGHGQIPHLLSVFVLWLPPAVAADV